MRIDELMTRNVNCCVPGDRLNQVAHVMWHQDAGVLPVVDSDRRLLGVITDRDVCMAAYSTGRPLGDLTVERAMSKAAHACRRDDTTETAHRLMRKLQIRRLPVVDEDRRLVGLLGLGDLARAAADDPAETEAFVETFGAISRPRRPAEEDVTPVARRPVDTNTKKRTTARESKRSAVS